jgi:hypothetical protein
MTLSDAMAGGGLAVDFLTDAITMTLKAIQKLGGVLLGELKVLPKAYQFFRPPDNRVYAIVQNKDYHAH